MSKSLRGIKGKDAIKVFVKAGGELKSGKGNHINIKMPNGMIITIPNKGELKVGLLTSAIKKAGLSKEEFLNLLQKGRN